ncbi:MAG: tetratricopeptide repeat protein [Candidatus Hodarchaeota archaeon]
MKQKSILFIALLLLSAIVFTREASAQTTKKVPVVVIGLEFPLTSATSERGLAGNITFPPSIIDVITQQQGTSTTTVRRFNSTMSDRFFGSTNSPSDYFSENSYGAMELKNAGIFGPYQAKEAASHYWREKGKKCSHGWSDGHGEKRSEAIHAFIQDAIINRNVFDLKTYDTNNDNIITCDELVVVIVYPQNSTAGYERTVYPKPGSNSAFKVGSISWALHSDPGVAEVYSYDFSTRIDIGLTAHELAHIIIDAEDLYENKDTLPATNGWDPTVPGLFSLMDNHRDHPHLDPLHKIEKGKWLNPIVVKKDGYYKIRAVEKYKDVYKLHDPNSHKGEYFLVENRQKSGYDSHVPGSGGLAIWHIDESRSDWRSRLELEHAAGEKKIIDWSKVLWTAYATTGGPREWWDDSQFINSRWHDKSKSYIGVFQIPASSSTMRVYLDVPGPGIFLSTTEKILIYNETSQNFNVLLTNTGDKTDTFELSFSGIDKDWIKISYVLPATVSHTKVNNYTSQFKLGSYEGVNVFVYVTVPRCTKESSQFISASARSITNPNVNATESTQLITKIPSVSPSADKLEKNDSFSSASPIKVNFSKNKYKKITDLTLHTGKDEDYFFIEYVISKADECQHKGSGAGVGMSGLNIQYYPGNISIALDEQYCRTLDLDVYRSDKSLYKSFSGVKSIALECPTYDFTDSKLYLVVKDTKNRKVFYDLSVTINSWFISMDRPLTDPPKIRYLVPWEKLFGPSIQYVNFMNLVSDLNVKFKQYQDYRSTLEVGELQHDVGRVAHQMGMFDDAEKYYSMCLEIFRNLENSKREADALQNLGILFSDMGREADALESWERASELHESVHDALGLAGDKMLLGRHHIHKGETAIGLALLQHALHIQTEHHDHSGRVLNLLNQAQAFQSIDWQEASVACLVEAKALLSVMDDPGLVEEFNHSLSHTQSQLGEEEFLHMEESLEGRADIVRQQSVSRLLELYKNH